MESSSRGSVTPFMACGLLLAGLLTYVPLAVDAGPVAFAAACTLLTVAALLMLAVNARRGDYGSAIAWGYTGLPIVLLLILIAIPLAHIPRLMGRNTCDPLAGDCGPVALSDALPLVFYCAALVTGWFAVRASKKRKKAERAAEREGVVDG